MQDRPDGPTLLDGVGQFLITEVLPRIEDKALAFRIMIAANLSTVVASQLRGDDERLAAEHQRLSALVPAQPFGSTRKEHVEALKAMNAALARRIREQGFDARIFAHVKQTALEALAVTNPRFDTGSEIE